ncbi:MAG: Glu-tRNA(Gln) amidotransferase GatDE subunit E [Candidatus Aminicenantes bacterium]|nr:Glu-tRNA(Gln) amidotransferase GatDE subunit E [Candidatus Aminicenantes bacterium]NIM77618.1 Glu-tRNA(Gln) amidotransferase GatDE subunit E [Candidatus Aminicenantes bacterium]NIN16932.1 Glu-tRNA(Gln) amidotransferase GatDE subunit E [Candidatus Aminicenantes bacterium]NIN40825.1 Glu-tRNA(Gln) amidotransferase GatDE subunit E [Candidatus Aminicenantes bacterium]NIN83629.1 Glu-tRNA(Gln) amidotransferase GatDE subunit E [Candidatus Aminicenantes bacterium]
MTEQFDPEQNYEQSRQRVGYVPRKEANSKTYGDLGFKCGLEIHQQLKTEKKLFCRCPAGIYHHPADFSAEVIRHMRPTLSELGEYDGTALMEFKTRKNITYRINNRTSCTYEIDDTPPFSLNKEALDIAIEIALLLKTNIVGELHITRKQYLDGSIPTGFQRTAIVGIEGEIPLKDKTVRIIQLSVEEEACREVDDVGHERIYTTDRLGMPLVETVTYPDMLTPDEAAEAGNYIRFLTRSTGNVRTGIGAAREDVNVSITGGTRVELKGVAHIKWIPEITHNEGFRQKALLEIKDILNSRVPDPAKWKITHKKIPTSLMPQLLDFIKQNPEHQKNVDTDRYQWVAVNLPQFEGILSFFTQPGKSFSNELSDRLKVIACIEKPNMVHSEPWNTGANPHTDKEINTTGGPDLNRNLNRNKVDFAPIKKLLKSGGNDAQLIFWGSEEDIATALETIEERCQLAFKGVLNETRKALPNGTTIFERVLPGPDRMYPDTDSAPIPIEEHQIQTIRKGMPQEVSNCVKQMKEWKIPEDTYFYILRRNLFPLIETIANDFNQPPRFTGTLIGHHLKYLEGQITPSSPFDYNRIYQLFDFIIRKKLKRGILKEMLPVVYQYPNMDFDSILTTIEYQPLSQEEILEHIPVLKEKFKEISNSNHQSAMVLWVMGQLRPLALGNMDLKELREQVETAVNNGGNNE